MQSGDYSNLGVKVLDGPGLLSKPLPQNQKGFLTTAFVGILHVRRLEITTYYFKISIKALERRHTVSTCFDRKQIDLPFNITASVTKKEGKLCFLKFRTSSYFFLKLAIRRFVFQGPRFIDNLFDCQYGGLFIYQPSSQKTTCVCEKRTNYFIYGDMNNFIMLLIWYPSYSYGTIVARLLEDRCITKHLQWSDHLEYNQISLRDRSFMHCHRVICPTQFNKQDTGENKHCKIYIKSGKESVVIAKISVNGMHALYPCRGTHGSNPLVMNMSSIYSNDWPIQGSKLMNSRLRINVNVTRSIQVDYLQSMNVSLPIVCDPALPLRQLGVSIKTAMCYTEPKTQLMISVYLGNKIHGTQVCLDRVFPAHADKVTEFIYTLPADVKYHTGLRTRVLYDTCPTQCRNYTYVLTVPRTYQNTVYRYTSAVGRIIFTGYFQQGVKLEVMPPKYPCRLRLGCKIAVSFHPRSHTLGTHKWKTIVQGAQEWQINSRRYL